MTPGPIHSWACVEDRAGLQAPYGDSGSTHPSHAPQWHCADKNMGPSLRAACGARARVLGSLQSWGYCQKESLPSRPLQALTTRSQGRIGALAPQGQLPISAAREARALRQAQFSPISWAETLSTFSPHVPGSWGKSPVTQLFLPTLAQAGESRPVLL